MYTEKEKKEIEFLLKQYVQGNDHVYEAILQKTSAKVRCVIDYMGIEENYVSIVMDSTHNFVKENLASVQDLSKFCDWLTAVAAIQAYYTLISYGLETQDADCRESNSYQNIKQRIDDDIELTKMLAIPEKSDFIWDKCKTMPAVARVTYLLYFVAEMSIDEISSTMNCSSDVVKERVNYIVATLKNDSTDYVRQESEGKKTKNKKTITIVLIILLVMFILDLVLFFVIMGQKKDKAGSGGKGEARETNVAAECETETDATGLDTTSTSNSFDESIYTDKYEKWKSIYESESMPESLGQKYNEELTAFQQAISDKDEQGCIGCDEKLEVVYQEIKEYKLSQARLKYIYMIALCKMCYFSSEGQVFPDGTPVGDSFDLKGFRDDFVKVYDFDCDENLELLINIDFGANGKPGIKQLIYEYDLENECWIKQFERGGAINHMFLYENGKIWYGSSKSTLEENEWIGDIYEFNPTLNIYEVKQQILRKNGDSFYLIDSEGVILQDNLSYDDIEIMINDSIGVKLDVDEICVTDYVNTDYREKYLQMLWEQNGLNDSSDFDLGKEFISVYGDGTALFSTIEKNVAGNVTEDGLKKYFKDETGSIVLTWDSEWWWYNTTSENFPGSICGIKVGMNYEEAKQILHQHGFEWYKTEDVTHYYVTDDAVGGYWIDIQLTNDNRVNFISVSRPQ